MGSKKITSLAAIFCHSAVYAYPTHAPVITSPPHLLPRSVPVMGQTWGYVSGDSNTPLTCADGYTATIDGMFGHDNIICCSHTKCTGDYNVCVAGGGPTTVLPIFTYTYALSCPTACVTYTRYQSQLDPAPFYSYTCGDTDTVVTVLASPVEKGALSSLPPTGTSSTLSTTPSNTSSSPSPTASHDPLSTPAEIGTIISAVIGFLALVVMIVFGVRQWRLQ